MPAINISLYLSDEEVPIYLKNKKLIGDLARDAARKEIAKNKNQGKK